MRSKAAVLYGVGEPFKIEEIEVDDPKPGEVMVRLVATGICHSDHHLVTGDMELLPTAYPMVAGHEGAGVVEKVGEGCTRVKPGDHVVLNFAPSCGHCRWCATGQQMMCDLGSGLTGGRQADGTTRMHTIDGTDLGQWVSISTFSEWTTCPENSCVVVGKHLPLDKIGLVGCGVPTGFGAVVNRAQLQAGETLAVFGAGGLGMNAIQGGVLSGASKIIAVEPIAFKRQAALEFGATHTIDPNAEDPVAKIHEITDNLGVDKAVVTVDLAYPKTYGIAVDAVRKGGRAVVVSTPHLTTKTMEIDPGKFGHWQKELFGTVYGGSNPQYDIPRLLGLYDAGKLKIDELVTQTYSLEQINEACDDMLEGRNIRGMIVF